ncbi:MAG: PBP1A family penicillin-binding protein [Actinomycetota bacterium]
MARTYQRSGRGGRPSRKPASKRPVRLPAGARKRKSRRDGLGSRIARAFGLLLALGIICGLAFAAGGYLGVIRAVNQLEEPRNTETHPTYIYSAPVGDNEDSRRVIGTIFQGQNRKTALKSEMPPHLLNALVAKEDERFMQHPGVDLWGIMRALYVDIRAGEKVEGASTITQQYVKNAYLSNDRTWKRKIKEALLALEVERRMNKDDILAAYLNTMFFGNNAYGIEAAAETYFNKSVEDLTIAESATLVGILWSPSTLGSDKDAAREQRDLVLDKMFNNGYISSQDHEKALSEPMPEEWPMAPMMETGLTGPQMARNFTDLVQEELVERYGATTVASGGLSVYTTLNLEDQAAATEVVYGPTGYLPSPDHPDAALVSIDPQTGFVTAMVGNRDQESHFNLVTQGRRQPGSSFKPFAYIAALEQGIDPDSTTFVSEKKTYRIPNGAGSTQKWKVENFSKVERGPINLTEALWESDNTVFTDLVMNVDGKGLKNGPEAVLDVAQRLGISVDASEKPHPSVVLGTREVSPLEHTAAYATIANGGRKVEPTVIQKVVRNEGTENEEVLYEHDPRPGKQVIEPEVARKTTEAMIGVVTQGNGGKAALGDRPVAGKTGTSERFFDSWFIGYTPQLVTGIWMGYAEGGATLQEYLDPNRGAYYGTLGSPTEIWHDYMVQATEDMRPERFEGVDDKVQNGAITVSPSSSQPTRTGTATSGQTTP